MCEEINHVLLACRVKSEYYIGDEDKKQERIMTEQEGAAQAIQVLTETRNLRTQPFIIPDEANSVGKACMGRMVGGN